MRREAGPQSEFDGLLSRIPANAIAVVAGRMDLVAAKQTVFGWLNDTDRRKAEHLLETLSGFTLGRSLPDEVLPTLGPEAVAVLAEPRSRGDQIGRPVLLFGLEFQGGDPMGRAIENGFRSLFTLVALDPKRASENLQVGSSTVEGHRLVTLTGPVSMVTAGVGPSVMALGNGAEPVAEFLSDPEPRSDGQEPMVVRDRQMRFLDADAFLHVDLEAAYRLGTRIQGWLVRSIARKRGGDAEQARHDVEQVLGLIRLFRAGYLTRTVSDDLNTVRHSLVLVPRDNLSGPK